MEENSKNTTPEDVFAEARQKSIEAVLTKNEIPQTSMTPEQRANTLATIKERVEEGETQWDLLKRMIDGSMTEKFIKILNTMPDRDYVRNYLKLLEHFKPKLVRGEDDSRDKQDTVINIQAVILNEKGEHEVIELNQYKKTNNGDEDTDV